MHKPKSRKTNIKVRTLYIQRTINPDDEARSSLEQYSFTPKWIPSSPSLTKIRTRAQESTIWARVWKSNVLRGWGLSNEATLEVRTLK